VVPLFIIAAALTACATSSGTSAAQGQGTRTASADDLPQWYLNPQDVYPDEQYLTSVGTGDTRRDAEQQAMAGLSQIFEAEIEVDSRTRERYSEIMTAQGTLSESEVELAQTTNIRSDQTLLNVQFGEAAVDDVGRVHVIAYIQRLPTARVYQDLIETNGAQVRSFLDQADESGGLIRRYSYVSAAAVVAQNNEVLRDQLRIISPGFSEMVDLPYDPDTVIRRRADLASQMVVSVSIGGDPDGRLAAVVREALSEERFPISSEDPVLQVAGEMSLSEEEGNPDFETVRWLLQLDMTGPDGSTLVAVEEQGRASGVSLDAARAFAYQDMEEIVGRELVGSMREYFDGVVLGD
jgi:hypothetical protein